MSYSCHAMCWPPHYTQKAVKSSLCPGETLYGEKEIWTIIIITAQFEKCHDELIATVRKYNSKKFCLQIPGNFSQLKPIMHSCDGICSTKKRDKRGKSKYKGTKLKGQNAIRQQLFQQAWAEEQMKVMKFNTVHSWAVIIQIAGLVLNMSRQPWRHTTG